MATRKPKHRYHHPDLRRALLDGALALIEERGADALSLREVARRAGVSHAACYRHFADKQAVLASVAEEGFGDLGRLMAEGIAHAGDDPLRRLVACGTAYVRYGLAQAARFRVMFSHQIDKGSGRFPALDAAAAATFGQLLSTVELGQRRGALRGVDPMPIAITAWSVVHGMTHLLVESLLPPTGDPDALVADVIGHAIDGVRAPHRPRRREP